MPSPTEADAVGGPAAVSANVDPTPAASTAADLVMMDAVDLAATIHARQASCREVMTAFLGQIDRFNPKVTAIVSRVDADALLFQADARDDQLARGEAVGWMHGFPHAVKDAAATRGIASTMGSPIFAEFVPEQDTIFVERLRDNGAILIGKTNIPEFGLGSHSYNPVFGTTANAYDPTRAAGGSSGGAAVALAMRMVPVADGSDTGGSLRNPAGWNNVFAFRPGLGGVPFGPSPEVFFQQFAIEGPMARTVADLAMLHSVMAGDDDRAPLSLTELTAAFAEPLKRDVTGTRIGWLGDLGGALPIEPGVLDLCLGAVRSLEAAGCTVEAANLEVPEETIWEAWLAMRHLLIMGAFGDLYDDPAQRVRMKPEAVYEIEGGLKMSARDVWNGAVKRSAIYEAFRILFQRFDFVVLPTAQVFPFDAAEHWPKEIAGTKMDAYHRWMEVAYPGSLSGLPVAAVPAGFGGARDLPMGLQFLGPMKQDRSVLQIAYAYEQANPWIGRRLPSALTAD
jgi:amidase